MAKRPSNDSPETSIECEAAYSAFLDLVLNFPRIDRTKADMPKISLLVIRLCLE